MSSVRENLIAAKALIVSPERWMKGNLQDAGGKCFCAYGAAAAIARSKWRGSTSETDHALCNALRAALPATFLPDPNGILDIAQYNDHPTTTHDDVMALYDRAIASLPLHEGSGE